MPLTVTRGNPWGVPASIRVLSKRSSPALPPRGHPRKYDFFVVESSTHLNRNRSCFGIGNRFASCAKGARALFGLAYRGRKWDGGRPLVGTNCL